MLSLEEQVKLFRERLVKLRRLENTILTVIEQGDDSTAIENHRLMLATLDSIIHQFDETVKLDVENNK